MLASYTIEFHGKKLSQAHWKNNYSFCYIARPVTQDQHRPWINKVKTLFDMVTKSILIKIKTNLLKFNARSRERDLLKAQGIHACNTGWLRIQKSGV